MTAELDFHLKEYEVLRGELADLEKAGQRLMTFTIAGSAATFAWLATNGDNQPVLSVPIYIAYFVPVLVAWMAWSVFDAWGAHIFRMGEYIWHLEQRFGGDGLGWEHFLHPEGQYDADGAVTAPVDKAYVFWWRSLFVGNLLIAVIADGAMAIPSHRSVAATKQTTPAAPGRSEISTRPRQVPLKSKSADS